MIMFLQVLGGILLAIVILLLAGYFYLRYRLRKFLAEADATPEEEPLIIHLNEEISPEWLDSKAAQEVCDELENLGFARGSAYVIYEMSAFQLVSYLRGPIAVAVYRHEALGIWCDVVLERKDGLEYTFSNASMGSGFDQRPDSKKINKPDYPVGQLVAAAENVVDAHADHFVVIAADEFRDYFEQAYKKDMAWKCRKGGVTYDEFLKTAAETGEQYDDQVIQQAFIQTKEDELYRWEQAALEDYQAQNGIADDDFWELEDKLVVVPFTSSTDAFVNYLEGKRFVTENQAQTVKRAYGSESDMIKLFDRLNGLLSPEIRADHLCDAEFPLRSKIYRLHESMGS